MGKIIRLFKQIPMPVGFTITPPERVIGPIKLSASHGLKNGLRIDFWYIKNM
jgi:hypothetical protein